MASSSRKKKKGKRSHGRHRIQGQKIRREFLGRPVDINLTSMIDMFTIILVFLLKAFSVADVSLSPPKNIMLPASTSDRIPTVSVKVSLSPDSIAVDDREIVTLKQGRVRAEDVQGLVIFSLYRELKAISDDKKDLESQSPDQKFERKIILFGDKNIPFDTLKRVLFTAGQAEFEAFRFSVTRKEAG